ncbi:CU044_2847 family protein [Streptomyces laurentii]|uniref:CU044_2847 family protein n=1 Tax=Streptomyces laurentii TaxID=39478 RepID=UPI0036C82765
MPGLTRLPLEGGGAILLEEMEDTPEFDGPVKAGRVGDAVRELPRTLQESLVPVRETARAVLDQLRQAGSREVEVEFGVNLSAKAGAVIASGETAVHLKVRVVWESGDAGPDAP